MSPDPAHDLARLRAIALALPSATDKISRGQPVFLIEKGRIFAQYWHDLHGDGRSAVIVRTGSLDEREMLIEVDPEGRYRPPYIGAQGWIAIRTDMADTDWDRIAAFVAESWRHAAPPRLLAGQP